jgi:hypothetical protein
VAGTDGSGNIADAVSLSADIPAGNEALFDDLARVEIVIEADPSVANLDFAIDNVELVCEGVGAGGLSETETFAQVDQFSGFTEAFSSSLAATSEADFDMIVT